MTDRALFAGYQVALVLSHAGMNEQQLADVKKRLREIARMGGADPDGLRLTVPVTRHEVTRRQTEHTEELVEPLRTMRWLRIEILEVGPIPQVLDYVKDHDEVWCVTTRNQSEQLVRPARIYQLAQRDPRIAGRFKLIHFWIEPEPDPIIQPRKPARKGY